MLPTGTVDVSPGQDNQALKIRVLRDAVAEPDEGFTVILSTGQSAPAPSATTTMR